jgi:predicted nucleic acid-binding protein
VSLIVDASLTLSWYFEDERTPATDAVLDQVVDQGAVVPVLWRLEVTNGLYMAQRRQRIDAAFRHRAIEKLARLPIAVDFDTDSQVWSATLRLADQHGLTIYDASYLELARRRDLPLASLDRELRAAAGALRLTLLGI